MEGKEGEDDTKSPGYQFLSSYNSMELLWHKLSLLQYSRDFCTEYKCKPIHRYYFAIPSNAGEQFYTFSCLSTWLIKSKIKSLSKQNIRLNPEEFEDPNVTISGILEALPSQTPSTSSLMSAESRGKLKKGSGPEVITLLTTLTDLAVKELAQSSSTITVKGLAEPSNSEEEEMTGNEDNDIEINLEQDQDEYYLMDEVNKVDQEDESDFFRTANEVHGQSNDKGKSEQSDWPPVSHPVSSSDPSQWTQELERVTPLLKLTLRPRDQKSDWRVHLNQLTQQKKGLDEYSVQTKGSLAKLIDTVTKNSEKILHREKYLQNQFETLISEYKSLKERHQKLSDNYKLASSGVTEKSESLSQLSDELENIKREMEERGSTMTDGTPLIALRKSLSRIKSEITSIDIRIGVATHTILRSNLDDVSLDQLMYRRDSNSNNPEFNGTTNANNDHSLHRLVF